MVLVHCLGHLRAPEAQAAYLGFIEAQKERSQVGDSPLEKRVQQALDSGMAFDYKGILYVPVRENSNLIIEE